MRALWIADAHLCDPASPPYRALVTLLTQSANSVDAVVLLGDFFQLWLGDNRFIVSRHRPILDVFASLRNQGVSLHYLKGNHDFIMGHIWRHELCARVYEEEASLFWDGYRFLASHGESIYRKDYLYLLMRGLLRSAFLHRSIRLLSDEAALRLSLRFASLSKGKPNQRKLRDHNTAFYAYAKKKIEQGYHATVLAHTHVRQWHLICVNHTPRLYVNPGSWHEEHTYLWYERGRFQVRQYRAPDSIILFDFTFPVP